MPIHDQSYRRYTGDKRPVQSAWLVIARAGLMTFLVRRAFLGLLLVAWIPFIVRASQLFLASNFSQRFRYTGAALTSDLAWLLGAAFAPLVALSLSDLIGPAAVGGYLLSGVLCTLAALRVNRQLEVNDR